MQKRFVAVLIAVFVAAGAGLATAQERFGGLTGIVTDASGGVLPGATVTVTSKTTGASRSQVTSADGLYSVPDLDPGRYALVVELSGFAKLQMDDVGVSLGKVLKVDAQLKVGDMSEVVQVQAEARPAIDLRSTLVAHNVTAEEFDRLPKGRSFQSLALTAPSVNSGEIEGGFQVNGAQRRRERLHGRRRRHQQPDQRQVAPEHGVRVPAGSAGQDERHRGGVRRRARRRHQRGDQVAAATPSAARAHYFYEGSEPERRPGQAARARSVGRRSPVTYVQDTKAADHQQRDRRIARRSDHHATSCSSSAPSRRAFANRTNEYRFSNGTEHGEIERKQNLTQAFGKVTYSSSRITATGSALYTPTTSEGTLPAYNGAGQNIPHQLRGGQRGEPASAASNRPDQHQRQRRHRACRTRRSCRSAAATSTTTTTTRASRTRPTTSISASSVGMPGVPPEPAGADQHAEHAARADHRLRHDQARNFFNVDYNHAFNAARLPHAEGRLRHPAHGQRRAARPTRAATSTSSGTRPSPSRRATGGRGTYGYYEVNDRGVQDEAGANIQSLYVQDQWTLGDRLTLNLGLRTEDENVPTFRPRRVDAIELRLGGQDRAASRRRLRRPRRRPDQGVRQLGPLLRLDQVRAAARLVRRRRLADLLPRARHARPRQPEPEQHAGRRPVGRAGNSFRDRRVPSFDSTDPDIKPM